MAFTPDFRTKQLQTNKIVASGSTGTNAKLLVYSEESENKSNPNVGDINANAFGSSSIGEDIFLYVSGTVASGSSTSRISVFGGSVVVSGNLVIKGHLSSAYGGAGTAVTNTDAASFGIFPIFKTDDGKTITTSSYTQVSSAFSSYLFGYATPSSSVVLNEEEFITSGSVNVALGRTAKLVSGYKATSPDYNFGFSSVAVTGSDIFLNAAGNHGSTVDLAATSYASSSQVEISSDGVITSSIVIESSADDSRINQNSIGVTSASFVIYSEADEASSVQIKATSFNHTASVLIQASDGVSSSINITASAEHYSRILISSDTTNANTTSSIGLNANHVEVIAANRVGLNTNPASVGAFGTDTYFHVSGSVAEKDVDGGKVAVLGGDVVISGNLHLLGTGYGVGGGQNISVTGSGVPLTSEVISLHLSGAIHVVSSSVTGNSVTFNFHSFNVLRDLRPHLYWNAENVVEQSGLVVTMSNLGSSGSTACDFTQSNSTYQCSRALDARGHYYLSPNPNAVGAVGDHYTAGDASTWKFLHDGSQEYFLWTIFERTGSNILPSGLGTRFLFDSTGGSTGQSGIMSLIRSQHAPGVLQVQESNYGFVYCSTRAVGSTFGFITNYYLPIPLTKSLFLYCAQIMQSSGSSYKGMYHPQANFSINGSENIFAPNFEKAASSSLPYTNFHLFANPITATSGFDGKFYEMGIVKGIVPRWKIDRLAQWVEEYYGSFD